MGLLDFTENMNFVIMATGFLMILIPMVGKSLTLTDVANKGVAPIALIVIMSAYGASLFVGGFMHGKAEYLGSFLYLAAVLGLLLTLSSFFIGMGVPAGVWYRVAVLSLVLVALPATGLVILMEEGEKKDFERDKEHRTPRHRPGKREN
ncbi:MAG: hypothetical protein ABEK01_00470 [Candidatus Nanohaloarchaea archaeon]